MAWDASWPVAKSDRILAVHMNDIIDAVNERLLVFKALANSYPIHPFITPDYWGGALILNISKNDRILAVKLYACYEALDAMINDTPPTSGGAFFEYINSASINSSIPTVFIVLDDVLTELGLPLDALIGDSSSTPYVGLDDTRILAATFNNWKAILNEILWIRMTAIDNGAESIKSLSGWEKTSGCPIDADTYLGQGYDPALIAATPFSSGAGDMLKQHRRVIGTGSACFYDFQRVAFSLQHRADVNKFGRAGGVFDIDMVAKYGYYTSIFDEDQNVGGGSPTTATIYDAGSSDPNWATTGTPVFTLVHPSAGSNVWKVFSPTRNWPNISGSPWWFKGEYVGPRTDYENNNLFHSKGFNANGLFLIVEPSYVFK